LHNEELYSYNIQVMLLGESKNEGVSGREHVTGKKGKDKQFYSNLVARWRLRNAGQLTARYGAVRVECRRGTTKKLRYLSVFTESQVATQYAYTDTPSVQ
jgi:hypothetical protein